MVIREILDGIDAELRAHQQASKRLSSMKERILACCRADAPSRPQAAAKTPTPAEVRKLCQGNAKQSGRRAA